MANPILASPFVVVLWLLWFVRSQIRFPSRTSVVSARASSQHDNLFSRLRNNTVRTFLTSQGAISPAVSTREQSTGACASQTTLTRVRHGSEQVTRKREHMHVPVRVHTKSIHREVTDTPVKQRHSLQQCHAAPAQPDRMIKVSCRALHPLIDETPSYRQKCSTRRVLPCNPSWTEPNHRKPESAAT